MTQANDVWVQRAESVARSVLARHAADVDSAGRWPTESVAALGEASRSLNSGLWWTSRQTALRIACGLSLWMASLLEQPLSRWLYGEG